MFICSSLHSIDNFYQMTFSSRLTNGFLRVWGTPSEYWSRFELITSETKKGHSWMQRAAEAVGEFLKGDWGRSRLITGGNIGRHNSNYFSHYDNTLENCGLYVWKAMLVSKLLFHIKMLHWSPIIVKVQHGYKCSAFISFSTTLPSWKVLNDIEVKTCFNHWFALKDCGFFKIRICTTIKSLINILGNPIFYTPTTKVITF